MNRTAVNEIFHKHLNEGPAGELSIIAKVLDKMRADINSMQDGLKCGMVSGLLAEAEVNINSAIMGVLAARKRIKDGKAQ